MLFAQHTNACFSLDGKAMLHQYNNISNGNDAGDWFMDCSRPRVQDATMCPGVANLDISPTAEILVLDVVGYDIVPTSVLTKVTSDTNGGTGGTCTTPSSVSSFTTSSAAAWLYFSVATAATGDSAQIQFLRPDGTVHSTTNIPATGTGFQCFSASVPIRGASAASFPGVWTARALWNGLATPLFSLQFIISAANCTFSLDSAGMIFPSSGGSGTVKITAPSNCFWMISDTPDWVSVTNGSGGGSSSATYQVLGNSGGARTGGLTIAGGTYTIEQQAASISGLSLLGSMPHIAAQGVWSTTFTLVNKSISPATARLNFFGDPSGALNLPLLFPQVTASTLPMLAASLDRNIAGGASLVVASGGSQAVPYQVGSAQLSATAGMDGFAIFRLIPGAQEAVVPLETRNASSYILAFDHTGGVVLGVAAQNVSNNFATISVVIRDDTGAIIGTPGTTFALAANGHTSFVLSDQYPITRNKRGTIEFITPSNGRISVLGIRTTPLQNTLTLTTIPALANIGTNGGSIAHIATGAGWQTTFVLVNTGTVSTQATLRFFATGTGSPLSIPLSFPQPGVSSDTVANSVTRTLAAGASLIVQSAAPASDPAPTIGSAQLTASGNVGGFVIFRYNPNGQEAVVPLESRTANAYVIAFDNSNGTATGIALNNASSLATAVSVIVRDDAGNQVLTDTMNLVANGHTSFTLGVDKFPAMAGKRGTVEFSVSSGGKIGVLGIRIPPTLTFTTLPPLAK